MNEAEYRRNQTYAYARFINSLPLGPSDVVIAESRGAQIISHADGSLSCRCPFMCSTVHEVCEFIPLEAAT